MSYVSKTLQRLLAAASIAPGRLDAAFMVRNRRRMGAMTHRDHFPRMITRACAVSVSRIVRRRDALLIEVTGPDFQYIEHAKRNVLFHCRGSIPEVARITAAGRTLGDVVELGHAGLLLGDSRISGIHSDDGTSLSISLRVDWIRL